MTNNDDYNIEEEPEMVNQFAEHEIITGDDCDEGGIADERFASPDPAFITEDIGRKSIESRSGI